MVHEEPGADRQQAGAIIARIRFEPGISLVDGRTAEDVKEELIRQLNDPESVLRQGKYGSRIKSLQTVHANTSAAGGRSGEPVGMAQRRPTSAMDHSLASSGSCTGTDAHTPDIGQDPGRLWRSQPTHRQDMNDSGSASEGSHDNAVEDWQFDVGAPERDGFIVSKVLVQDAEAVDEESPSSTAAKTYHMMPSPPPMTPIGGCGDGMSNNAIDVSTRKDTTMSGLERWRHVTRSQVIQPSRAEGASAFSTAADAVVQTAKEIFAQLRRKRAQELAEEEAAMERERAEEERQRHENFLLRSSLQHEIWRKTLHDLEQELHHEALRHATEDSQMDVGELVEFGNQSSDVDHVTERGHGPSSILDQLKCPSPDIKDNEQHTQQTAGGGGLAGYEKAEKCTPDALSKLDGEVWDIKEFEKVTTRPSEESVGIAPEKQVAGDAPPQGQFGASGHQDRELTQHVNNHASGESTEVLELYQSVGSSQSGEAEHLSKRLHTDARLTENDGLVQAHTAHTARSEALSIENIRPCTEENMPPSQHAGAQQRTHEFSPERIQVEEKRRDFRAAQDNRVAAQLAVARRWRRHLQALADSETTHKELLRTARFMQPVRGPVEPEIAQEQLNQKREHERQFECKHGTGRPRCSAGSALLPHFPIPMSSRPRDLVVESEAELKHFVSKRSIPSLPPHWGKVHEPYVTRGHRKRDESIQRIRDMFQKIFHNVAEAFVFCDSYRVGYIELASMKARLLTLGFTARPEDVNGLDMERVFLLATGKATTAMHFFQFCRQFTWDFPLTVEQENAWHRQTQASSRKMSAIERAAIYSRDLNSLARPRPNGPEPFLDAVEELLLDPNLFEKFCVIEGHSALQSGSRRLSMDQSEWLSLLVYLRILPKDAMKKLFKSQTGKQVDEDTELGQEIYHPDPRVVSLQNRFQRQLTKKEAMTAFFAGDTSEEKDGEMNFREYCVACQNIALILVSGGENRTIEVAKFETEKDAFNFEAWRRHIIEQEAVKASGQAFEVCADQEDAEEVEGHEIEEAVENIILILEKEEEEKIISCGVKNVVESLVTGVEEQQKRDEMAEARKLEAEAQAYESKVQHEVHACMQRMLAELQLQQDQKLVAEVQEILQQETGFFLWKLIQAVKGRLHVMQKARKFGHEFCRQRSLSIQNQRLDSRAQDRRRFLAKNAEPFLFKHLAENGARSQLQPEVGDDRLIFEKEAEFALSSFQRPAVCRDLDQRKPGELEPDRPKIEHVDRTSTDVGPSDEKEEKGAWNSNSALQSSHAEEKAPFQMLAGRTYIDPDFQRLATVFQTYFPSVQDAFVYINSRLDFAGITIDDLKKALVRLRLARAPPFTCFFVTVYGYNFGRMWRRAGAQTEKHPLEWAQFDRAFRWHDFGEDEAPDITACFSRRSSILNSVVRKIIDFDKLAQSEAARVQVHQKQALKLTMYALAERSRAVFRLKAIIHSLQCAVKREDDEDGIGQCAMSAPRDDKALYPEDDEAKSYLKSWAEEVAFNGIHALLCQARRELLTLDCVYTPPSFNLCGDAPNADQAGVNSIPVSERSVSLVEGKKHSEGGPEKYEDHKAVVICELQELQELLRNIASDPNLSYNIAMKGGSPLNEHTQTVNQSTLSMWRQARQDFTLSEYPVREDRDMKRWEAQRPESQLLVRQRFCRRRRFMNLRLLPRPEDEETALNVSAGFESSPRPGENGPVERLKSAGSIERLKSAGSTASSRRAAVGSEPKYFDEIVKPETFEDFLGMIEDDLQIRQEDQKAHEEEREFNGRKIVMESLRTQRKQRDVSTDNSLPRTSSGGSLHGRAHQTGTSMLRHVDDGGKLTMDFRTRDYIEKKARDPRKAFGLHHLGVTPIRKLSGFSNHSIYSQHLVWSSKRSFSRGVRGEVLRPKGSRYPNFLGAKKREIHCSAPVVIVETAAAKRRKYAMRKEKLISRSGLALKRTGSGLSRTSSAKSGRAFLHSSSARDPIPEETYTDFWPDYLRQDLILMAERKLLRHKLIGVRRQVTLETTQTFLCLEIFEGKVTRECEALGLCANERKQIKLRRMTMMERSLAKERPEGQWIQAQRDMERDQLEKQMDTTRGCLSDSGWNILEEEGNKTAHDTAQKTRTQMLREEAIRRNINSMERQREREAIERIHLDHSASPYASNVLPPEGQSIIFKPRPPSSPSTSTRESIQRKFSQRPTSAPVPQRYHIAAYGKTCTRPETSPDAPRNQMPASGHAKHGGSARQRGMSLRVGGADKLAEALLLERMLQLLSNHDNEADEIDTARREPQDRMFHPTHKSVRDILKEVFDRTPDVPDDDSHFDLQPGSSAEHPPFLRRKSTIRQMNGATLMRRQSLCAEVNSSPEMRRQSLCVHQPAKLDEDDKLTQELATRLHSLKRLDFLQTLRKQTEYLATQTLNRSMGPSRGKIKEFGVLRSQLQDLKHQLIRL